MKVNFLILAMVIMSLLFVGGVSADTATANTTKVVGSIIVPEKSVVITPPPTPLVWQLSSANINENEITVGDIYVVANCDYTLAIRGSTGGYMIGEGGPAMSFPTLVNALLVWDGTKFSKIEDNGATELVIYHGHAGSTYIPLKLRQHILPADLDKINPKIVLSYVAYY